MARKKSPKDWVKGPLTVTAAEEYGLYRVEEIADAEDGRVETDDAICRLFAAAPDLLAAVEALFEVHSARRHPLGAPDEGIAEMAAVAAIKARAAIAKAKGEHDAKPL